MTILFSADGFPTHSWTAAIARHLPGRGLAVEGRDAYDPATVDYALVWKQPHGLFRPLTGLKAVFVLGAGVDKVMTDPHLPACPIARVVDPDLTMRMTGWVTMQVLAHQRGFRHHLALQAAHRWEQAEQPAASAVRVGVMGLGELGRDACAVLARLGFQVAGWSRTARALDGIATFSGPEGLGPFLARTDILVSLLPLTPDTRGLIDRRLIDGLAHDGALGGPFLINAGRGGLQVEADILAALDDGRLAGATLDVFETEPLPPESPLWDHPKVTVTPHNAADSDAEAIIRLIARQIARFEAGDGLAHVVDSARGY